MPFFIKWITNSIAGNLKDDFLAGQFKTHYEFLEEQLKTSREGGEYLCGKDFTAADIMVGFSVQAGQGKFNMNKETYPRICAYTDIIFGRDAYKRSVEKIEEVEGSFKMKFDS